MPLKDAFLKKYKLKRTSPAHEFKQAGEQVKIKPALYRWGGSSEESRTCCGVFELTGLPLEQSWVDKIVLDALGNADNGADEEAPNRCLMYYSVDPKISTLLRNVGFRRTGRFVNPNTNNTVEIMQLTLGVK
jgi:hypothetical protein